MMVIHSGVILRRWSQGLIFHQAAVDCTRATMLLPLALSHHFCRPVAQCSIFETVFLLLATVSAVNLLTTVLNDTPLMPDDDGIDIDWLVNSPDTSHWLQDDVDDDGPTKVPYIDKWRRKSGTEPCPTNSLRLSFSHLLAD